MQYVNIPAKFPKAWGAGAGPTYIRTIPEASQIGVHDGWASLTDGYPPLTMTPLASGGVPPFGQDENGILNWITAALQWLNAGGPFPYDATFSGKIGGYPQWAVVPSASKPGVYYVSLIDNNTSNPDAGGANWKAFTPFGSSADYYVDGGSVNALVLAVQPAPNAYYDGMSFLIDPAHANTGATTLTVNSLAAMPIVHTDGAALQAGEVQAGQLMRVGYLAGSFQWLNPPAAATRAAGDNSKFLATTAYADRAATNAAAAVDNYGGQIYGLQTVPTPGSTSNSITVAVGSCRDSTNAVHIDLLTPMAKRLDQLWVAGTGNGGRLDSTALAAGQTWFLHIIENTTSGVVDWGYSQSPTAPPLPSGYTKFRCIWAILLNPSDTGIKPYIQNGDTCTYLTRSADYAVTANGGGVPYYRTISVPVGIIVTAHCYFQSTGTNDDKAYLSAVLNPGLGTPPAWGSSSQYGQIRRLSTWTFFSGSNIWDSYGTTMLDVDTDNSGHVYTFSNDNADVIALGVVGWTWQRGRLYP